MQLFKKDLRFIINTVYILGLIVLIIIGIATYQSFSSAFEKNLLVEHTNQVIYTTEQVLSLMKDAETGQRGYILTKDSVYLEPYFNSIVQVPVQINKLDALTADNRTQQIKVDTLKERIEQKYNFIKEIIELKNSNNIARLNEIYASKTGKYIMDRIRQQVQAIEEEENKLLAVRNKALDQSILIARAVIFIVIASSFFIALILYVSVRQQLHAKEAYERELNKVNKELAASNEELAAMNEELSSSHEEMAASNEELLAVNEELKKAEEKLTQVNTTLDNQIKERTKALQKANEAKALLLARERAALAEADNQRKRLHTLFLQAPAQMAILRGPDFVYELANPLYLQMIGKDAPVNGKPLAQVLPDLEPAIIDLLQQVYRTGERFIGKELPVTLDWEHNGKPYTKYFNVIYEPVREIDGRIDGIISFGFEVTEHIQARKKIEETAKLLNEANLSLQIKNERLTEAQMQFQFLSEFMPQLVWRTQPNGDHDYFNQRWYDYTGLSYEETKDKGWSLVVHPDDYERTITVWNRCLATGDQYEIEYRFKKADGTYRWFLGRALPMRDEHGTILKWFGTCTDIDEQKRIFEHLEQSRQELSLKNEELNRINLDLDNFIYTASHDLKSPITNIEGLTTVLLNKRNLKLDGSEKELIKMINLSVSRLKQTIVDLTEITKVQKDLDAAIEPVLLDEVLADVKADINSLLIESRAIIYTNLEVAQINFARKNIRSILYNLLSNAIKYRSPERPVEIHVTTKKQEPYVLLSVSDNGLGIKADQLNKIFMMFKRAHTHVEGTGVGLYIVKRIIENSGGKIVVDSIEGNGTTFTVYFKYI